MQTKSLSTKEEKELVRQVQDLDKMRSLLAGSTTLSNEADDLLKQKNALFESCKARNVQIDQLNAQMNQIKGTLDEYYKEKDKELEEVYSKKRIHRAVHRWQQVGDEQNKGWQAQVAYGVQQAERWLTRVDQDSETHRVDQAGQRRTEEGPGEGQSSGHRGKRTRYPS